MNVAIFYSIKWYYCFCFSNAYMVYLMIVQRSRNAERVMVFDVKQFKSLEGFLESGPQFVLQAYILLRNPLEEGIYSYSIYWLHIFGYTTKK